jgi:hypothetical protein
LLLLGSATAVTAQSFNQELARYRASKIDCEQAYLRLIERGCRGQCLTGANERKTRCLATAESRYAAALRRALRLPRR